MSPRVLFEPDTGRLRLDGEAFHALDTWAEGGDVHPDGFTALRKAGVATDDQQPHPAILPALTALAKPECLFALYINATDDSALNGAGWMGTDTAALLLDAEEDLLELITLAPAFMPAALARVLDISPRLVSDREPITVPQDALEAYFSIEHPSTGQPIPDVLTMDGTRRLEIAFRSPEGENTLRVADGPDGYWYVNNSGNIATLQPATPATIWRQLLQQFPT